MVRNSCNILRVDLPAPFSVMLCSVAVALHHFPDEWQPFSWSLTREPGGMSSRDAAFRRQILVKLDHTVLISVTLITANTCSCMKNSAVVRAELQPARHGSEVPLVRKIGKPLRHRPYETSPNECSSSVQTLGEGVSMSPAISGVFRYHFLYLLRSLLHPCLILAFFLTLLVK